MVVGGGRASPDIAAQRGRLASLLSRQLLSQSSYPAAAAAAAVAAAAPAPAGPTDPVKEYGTQEDAPGDSHRRGSPSPTPEPQQQQWQGLLPAADVSGSAVGGGPSGAACRTVTAAPAATAPSEISFRRTPAAGAGRQDEEAAEAAAAAAGVRLALATGLSPLRAAASGAFDDNTVRSSGEGSCSGGSGSGGGGGSVSSPDDIDYEAGRDDSTAGGGSGTAAAAAAALWREGRTAAASAMAGTRATQGSSDNGTPQWVGAVPSVSGGWADRWQGGGGGGATRAGEVRGAGRASGGAPRRGGLGQPSSSSLPETPATAMGQLYVPPPVVLAPLSASPRAAYNISLSRAHAYFHPTAAAAYGTTATMLTAAASAAPPSTASVAAATSAPDSVAPVASPPPRLSLPGLAGWLPEGTPSAEQVPFPGPVATAAAAPVYGAAGLGPEPLEASRLGPPAAAATATRWGHRPVGVSGLDMGPAAEGHQASAAVTMTASAADTAAAALAGTSPAAEEIFATAAAPHSMSISAAVASAAPVAASGVYTDPAASPPAAPTTSAGDADPHLTSSLQGLHLTLPYFRSYTAGRGLLNRSAAPMASTTTAAAAYAPPAGHLSASFPGWYDVYEGTVHGGWPRRLARPLGRQDSAPAAALLTRTLRGTVNEAPNPQDDNAAAAAAAADDDDDNDDDGGGDGLFGFVD
ncbi:hypothetical protein VOLCADRAFT_96189 [Volvox carteri f. nagariensis]|uniref:Uncharacterized protein n=1 Tax=Volvox carteri f. nagariensis TaxID=3068 RepID=D8U9G2_VOLCA|nr:uncharacterized protein VOLCADRAFT_96189 [Volvox carteri f. nagariensis]EFJ43634.1 hypothetical protein VOLCADRAFT_96189 [Volvox carteri f. nagariensis]|eukprot:XP_002955334.1 hypothetical protein VOLCADRAFT_96189 [Volvox carteri f. nagariensis]